MLRHVALVVCSSFLLVFAAFLAIRSSSPDPRRASNAPLVRRLHAFNELLTLLRTGRFTNSYGQPQWFAATSPPPPTLTRVRVIVCSSLCVAGQALNITGGTRCWDWCGFSLSDVILTFARLPV